MNDHDNGSADIAQDIDRVDPESTVIAADLDTDTPMPGVRVTQRIGTVSGGSTVIGIQRRRRN